MNTSSLLRSVLEAIRHLAARMKPALLAPLTWIYVVLAAYITVGTYAFPEWWKTFLFGGGLFDTDYWIEGWRYISVLIATGQPLGIALVAVASIGTLALVYFAGRRKGGIRKLRPPARRTVVLTSCLLALSLLGLSRVTSEYVSDTAHDQRLERFADQLRSEYESDPALMWAPAPPPTGMYLYLDEQRLGQMFGTLQNDFKTASETATTELETEAHGILEAGVASAGVEARKRLIQSVERLPTPQTASRQAEWLTHAYRVADIALRVRHDRIPEKWRSAHAVELLNERGVVLSKEQLQSLVEGEARLVEQQLRTQNLPLLFHGEFTVTACEPDTLQFCFTAGENGSSQLIATASGHLRFLDGAMKACAQQPAGCRRHGNILGVIWSSRRSGATVTAEFVPLAVW